MALQQLLPGIPDDITLKHITTKLPWKPFLILPSVSRAWRDAIRNGQVSNARSSLTESLVLINYPNSFYGGIFEFTMLYSMSSDSLYELPPIPGVEGFQGFHWVSVNGKIYLLEKHCSKARDGTFKNKLYVFDVAGTRQWNQCASLTDHEDHFLGTLMCGVMNDNIYIFGNLCGLQVYDPSTNTWSKPGPGNLPKIWIHGGVLHREQDYHPLSWPVSRLYDSIMFVAHGKIHLMEMTYGGNGFCIYAPHDLECRWVLLHSSIFPPLGLCGSTFRLLGVLEVDGELLVGIHAIIKTRRSFYPQERLHHIRSQGFGSKTESIQWHNTSLSFNVFLPLDCPGGLMRGTHNTSFSMLAVQV